MCRVVAEEQIIDAPIEEHGFELKDHRRLLEEHGTELRKIRVVLEQ
jgi:hypothetical protein